MQHVQANDQLSAYLDGELDEAEVSEVEVALANDPDLREELAKLARVAQLLRAHGPVRAPEGFKDAVLAKVAQMPQPQAAPWWRRPFGVPIEGMVLALAAATVLWVALPASLPPTPNDADLASIPDQVDAEVAAAAPVEDTTSEKAKPALVNGEADANLTDGVAALDEPDGSTMKGAAPYVSRTGKSVKTNKKVDLGAKGGAEQSDNTGNTANTAEFGPENTAIDNTGGMEEAPAQEAQEKQIPTQLVGSGVAYTLYVDDPADLLAIRRLVGAHGGELQNSDGSLVSMAEFNAFITQLLVNLPAEKTSDLLKELEKIGTLEQRSNDTRLHGEQMVLNLTVKVTGGIQPDTFGQKNAAPSQQGTLSEDAMEAAEPLEAN
ncbi:MAG: hypothetical protein GWP91_23780 [Rhodobacterales bacterium]|nr:hypothetical protein [Rhodobacterales bacterium]